MPYEKRIVAFIDILGFKDSIDKTIDKDGNDVEDAIDLIKRVNQLIQRAWGLDASSPLKKYEVEYDKGIGRVATVFSDSIVVSFYQSAPGEVFQTLSSIQLLIMELINVGILCRGALSYGKMIHTNDMVFGPALVDAYLTEQKAALYPRVIVSPELLRLAKANGKHRPVEELSYLKGLLQKDTDGMYYVDYFLKAQNLMDDPNFGFLKYIINISNVARSGVRSRKPDVRIKHMWLKEKINAVIKRMKEKETLERLSEFDASLGEGWKNLKPI